MSSYPSNSIQSVHSMSIVEDSVINTETYNYSEPYLTPENDEFVRIPAIGKLGVGKEIIISSCALSYVNDYSWCINSCGYPETNIPLHRYIWNIYIGSIPNGYVIDHINNDVHDNRFRNLRLATTSQNNRNSVGKPNKTGYKGVYKSGSGWASRITYEGQAVNLGTCSSSVEAAFAYDMANILLFREYGQHNNVGDEEIDEDNRNDIMLKVRERIRVKGIDIDAINNIDINAIAKAHLPLEEDITTITVDGVIITIDRFVLPSLICINWIINTDNYVRCRIHLHRFVWKVFCDDIPDDHVIDHIDRNRLNGSISNLRLATYSQNLYNSTIRSNNTSGFKGVSKCGCLWEAGIRYEGNSMYLGRYEDPIHAALAYDIASVQVAKEYASHNSVEVDDETRDEVMEHVRKRLSGTQFAFDSTDETESKSEDTEILGTSSGYTGVTITNTGRWQAKVYFKGKEVNLGTYDNVTHAASARAMGEELLLNKNNRYPDIILNPKIEKKIYDYIDGLLTRNGYLHIYP